MSLTAPRPAGSDPAAVTSRTVTLPDGRELYTVAAGPADGEAFVFHPGTPCGPELYAPMVAEAARRGLRTILYARPGYGASTPRPGRSVADAAGDTAAVLDAWGHTTFVTAGWSGGGPHALACAALLPERCLAVATIAGVAPYRGEGLDWLAGMGPENLDEFAAAEAGRAPLEEFLRAQVPGMAHVTPDEVGAVLGGLAPPVDRAVLTGEYAEFTARMFRSALATGIAGWRDDDLAFVRDWGFDLADVGPVAVWQGDADTMVPFAHGRWLAARLPGARAQLRPGQGHLSIAVGAFGEILDDLLAARG